MLKDYKYDPMLGIEGNRRLYIGMILKNKRESRGWSQKALSEYSKVSVEYIRRSENGYYSAGDSVDILCNFFGIDMIMINNEFKIIKDKARIDELKKLVTKQKESLERGALNLKSFESELSFLEGKYRL